LSITTLSSTTLNSPPASPPSPPISPPPRQQGGDMAILPVKGLELMNDSKVKDEEECEKRSHKEVILDKLYHDYMKTRKPHKLKEKATTSKEKLTNTQHDHSDINKKSLMELVKDMFPHVDISSQMQRKLWQQEMKQLKAGSVSYSTVITPSDKKIEEMKWRQNGLLKILRKELKTNQRLVGIEY
jgi:hypothetical protein